MKKNLSLIAVLCVIGYVVPCYVYAAGLLKNSDFSALGEKKRPTSWNVPHALRAVCSVVNDDGHSGKYSLCFRIENPQTVAPVTQLFNCKPNHDYIFSTWMKSDGKLRPSVRVTVPGKARKVVVSATSDGEMLWQGKSIRFNSGANKRLVVEIYADASALRGNPTPVGTAWVDDVQIREPESEKAAGGFASKTPGPNIALGKPYTFSRRPNYGYCTDDGDRTQLTDGEYSTGYFWVQKSTVGWNHVSPVGIKIDLQKVEPICGLSYSTAAGTAGVGWPSAIFILVSEDGKQFFHVGELTQLSSENGMPDPKRYATHRYVTDKLATKGRYVQLLIRPAGSYTFCDEIEVYRGNDELLSKPYEGKPIRDVEEFAMTLATDIGVRTRLRQDLANMRKAVAASKLDDNAKAKAQAQLDQIAKDIKAMPLVNDPNFRAVIPFNDIHRRILRINAAILRARGAPPFFIWHKNRWDMLEPTEVPEVVPDTTPTLKVVMMDNEYRAEVFNMTNATDAPLKVKLRVEGLPGGTNPPYIIVQEVKFVDTQEKVVIADALPLARRTDEGFEVSIPAGMTQQVWLTFHPQGIAAGIHNGTIVVQPGADLREIHVPLKFRIFPFRFPDQPTLSLGMWDYTDVNAYDITPGNRDAAIENMRAHFVDSPWAHPATTPKVQSGGVDAQGNLTKPIDFSRFDKWVEDWRDSRNYLVFMSVGGSFMGKSIGTPAFDRAVSQWAAAWAEHNKAIGLKPKQVGVLLVDEPHAESADRRILAWAKAIKAGTSDIVIWEDPVHRQPWEAKVQEMFKICDVLCPNLAIYYRGGERTQKFFANLRAEGKQLWFYQCSGPGRLHDPYYYHRLQHWHCWRWGAVGSGFWAYGDAAGTSPWNDYRARRTSYTPVYLAEDSVTDGKHWEAVREGIEDYEYLRMLRDRIEELKARRVQSPTLTAAEKLLREVPTQVAGALDARQISWLQDKDRSLADGARVRLLKAMLSLKK